MNLPRPPRFVSCALAALLCGAVAAQPAAPVTLLQNVRVFDGRSAALSGPRHVLVRDV